MHTTLHVPSNQWKINDPIVALREWGTDTRHELPEAPTNECTVGAAEPCAVRLDDASRRLSRVHARLIRTGDSAWLLRDAGSANGVTIDGAKCSELRLEPGLEIGMGGVTLIAESAQLAELRRFLERLLGWQTKAVDHALRAVRMAAARRTALVLCGEGDLVPIALSLHRRIRGADQPFVVCDPRRRSTSTATVRSPENRLNGVAAVEAADGGSLCIRERRLPKNFGRTLDTIRHPSRRVQLVVCAREPDGCARYAVEPIVIPPLATRATEIDRIIREYADDAVAAYAGSRFLTADHGWVRERASGSLAEIEAATLRLVALRASKNLSHAAAQLGMAPVSLSRWIKRRGAPPGIEL